MTRGIITYLFLFLLVVSCNREDGTLYTVTGHANNIASDILVFGLDSRLQKVDSLKADKKGNFSYSIKCDTIVPFIMVMPDGKQVTLFAEPGVRAELMYDCISQQCNITNGGITQTLHDSITQIIDDCPNNKKRLEEIEKFITEHPVSEVNIELLRRYLINVPNPDYQHIKNYISKTGGILQDNEYLAITKKNINEKSGNTLHKQFPSFTYETADSAKQITLSTFNKKHLLVTIWASWDEESRTRMKFLKEIDQTVKENNFEILNIAFEHDTAEWKRCVTNDSIIGYNVCETKAWNSDIAKKFKIKSLPYSILVNAYQRIIRDDVNLEKDGVLIDSIVTKHEKSQREREKREKEKEKRKNKKR